MRILMVSFNFPPYNVIGAVRAGKLAKFLHQRGHDVRVLTAAPQMFPPTLPREIPDDAVVETGWVNLNRPFEWLARRLAGSAGTSAGPAAGVPVSTVRSLIRAYRAVVGVPDMQVGWLPSALTRGHVLTRRWSPDVIFASTSPATSLVVGSTLARWTGAPWVAEFRDLWTDNPYSEAPAWRRALDRVLERRTLATVSAAVTISDPLARALRAHVHVPVLTVTNGFDPDDFTGEPMGDPRAGTLKLFYGGTIYPGRRDPAPLFAAMAALGPAGDGIEVEFSGQDLRGVTELAARYGVSSRVRLTPFRPYRESLRALASADIALLLLWNDPAERGVLPVKLFEYLGARRPVLTIGYEGGEAARIVRERGAGVVLNEPTDIAAWLAARLDEKRRTGRIAPLPAGVGRGFSRAEQFAALEVCLEDTRRRARS